MMRRRYRLAVVWACLVAVGLVHAGETDDPHRETVYSPNAFKVPYLGMDGTFTLDQQEISATDPRNPPRLVFRHMESFSFYADLAGTRPLAKECRYVYKGAAGDPFYYPTRAKTSIWDLFELASGDAACNAFSYVAIRAPHGNPIHMHLRYGNAQSSFRELLQLSDSPEDKTKLDPWWSVYCVEGVSGCDK
jgi:hypothetical protein